MKGRKNDDLQSLCNANKRLIDALRVKVKSTNTKPVVRTKRDAAKMDTSSRLEHQQAIGRCGHPEPVAARRQGSRIELGCPGKHAPRQRTEDTSIASQNQESFRSHGLSRFERLSPCGRLTRFVTPSTAAMGSTEGTFTGATTTFCTSLPINHGL